MIYTRLFVSLLFLMVCSICIADDQKHAVKHLFENTGLKSVLENVPEQIRRQAWDNHTDEHESLLSAEDQAILFKYLHKDYLYTSFIELMNQQMDTETLDILVEQTTTPVIKKIQQIEIATSKTQQEVLQKQMADYFEGLKITPPSQKRLDLIMDLESASKATDSIVFLMEKVMRGVNQVMSTGKEPVNNQQIEQEISIATLMMQNVAKTQIIMMMHFTYRDVDDKELSTYLDMLQTKEKQQFLNTSVEALGEVFLNALQKGFDELIDIKLDKSTVAI